MKNDDKVVPGFYCKRWINEQGHLSKFRSERCVSQCHKCMDVIIDHHFNKKGKESK